MSITPTQTADLARRVLDEIEKVVVGRRRPLELVLLGILGRGHVLLEDVPGLGKTMMARCFSEALGLTFNRVQFTPDLLPADLTGVSVFDQRSNTFVYHPGPVFTQLLLADEINRTPPKTQAALLEAMAEEQVSADGETRPLPQPFIVLATDNPIEYEGTYALPEAQLDRFLLRVRLGYLSDDDEQELLARRLRRGSAHPKVDEILDARHAAGDAREPRTGGGRARSYCAMSSTSSPPAERTRRSPSARARAAGSPSSRWPAVRRCSKAAATSRPRMSRRWPCPPWLTGSACAPSSGCAGSPATTSSPNCSSTVPSPR